MKNNSKITAIFQSLLSLFSFRLLISGATFLLAFYIFTAFTHELFIEKEYELDYNVIRFLSAHQQPGLYETMKVFTFFGSSKFLFPAYSVLVLYYLFRKKLTEVAETSVTGISSTVILHGMKFLFRRDRPDSPLLEPLQTYSFPSGHALSSFVFCSLLIYLIWKSKLSDALKWVCALLLLLFSLCVGISRVVLQVHYASDVICGFCIGYMWVLLSLWLHNKWIKRKQKKLAAEN